MHLKVFTKCQMLCNAYDDMSGFSILNTRGVTRFHQILAAVTNFARIVPILSSNSESVLKTGLVFAYELKFRRSIYQNRSEIFLDPLVPRLVGFRKFYFGQKLVTRSSFRAHKLFVNFEHVFWIFQATPFTNLSSYFLWLLLLCS